MSVYKYNSIRYNGGIDISNTVNITPANIAPAPAAEKPQPPEPAPEPAEQAEEKADIAAAALEELVKREAAVKAAENELEKRKSELAALREQYIEQGKQVIIEAKRRADGIVANANSEADGIVADAEKKRGDVFIKARTEGFEQGKKDGAALVLTESRNIPIRLTRARRNFSRGMKRKSTIPLWLSRIRSR